MRELKFSPRGENRMNKVTCGITMSLDAFVAGPNQSFENPFGDIDETILHGWMFEEPEKHQAQLKALTDAGAFIMGSNMYGPKEKRESPDCRKRSGRAEKCCYNGRRQYDQSMFISRAS